MANDSSDNFGKTGIYVELLRKNYFLTVLANTVLVLIKFDMHLLSKNSHLPVALVRDVCWRFWRTPFLFQKILFQISCPDFLINENRFRYFDQLTLLE